PIASKASHARAATIAPGRTSRTDGLALVSTRNAVRKTVRLTANERAMPRSRTPVSYDALEVLTAPGSAPSSETTPSTAIHASARRRLHPKFDRRLDGTSQI